MAGGVSRACSSLRYENEAHKDNEVDPGEVVDEPADLVDSEAVKRLVHPHVDECTDEIDIVASEGGLVESRRVD